MGIRVLCGGWGFASTSDLTRSGIARAVIRAIAAAKASGSCLSRPIVLAPEPAYRTTWVSPHLIDPFTVADEQKLSVLHESARQMLAVKGVTLARGYMTFTKENKLFVSSGGSVIDQLFIRSSCGIDANAKNDCDQQRRSYPNSFGGQHENAGFE